MSTFRIDQSDMALFASASHDINPLHMSETYAHRTPFGQPVVFGILTTLTALRFLPERPAASLASLTLNFGEATFRGVDYTVRFDESRGRRKMTVEDAGRKILTGSLEFRSTAGEAPAKPVRSGGQPGSSAILREFASLHPGLLVEGRYSPAEGPFGTLLDRLDLAGKGVQAGEVAALLWASYLVGMELPGERALFARLKVAFQPADGDGPIDYLARVESADERFDLVDLKADLGRGGRPFAAVEISAYVRRDSPRLSQTALKEVLPASNLLEGKVALVVGGSRGLGAALVSSLVQQGATVLVNYRSSHDEARSLGESLAGESGRVELVPGDATDRAEWARIRSEVIDRFGGLDLLVCNAAPPPKAMGLDLDSLDRLLDYVSDQLAMVAAPLATFAKLLNHRSGSIVLVSSIWVTEAPPDFSHYVAAKVAVEALAREVAANQGKLRLMIARPPRLLTDLTNTPGIRGATVAVERIAGLIVKALVDPDWADRVKVEEFRGEVAS